jgi:hypothetical protein
MTERPDSVQIIAITAAPRHRGDGPNVWEAEF